MDTKVTLKATFKTSSYFVNILAKFNLTSEVQSNLVLVYNYWFYFIGVRQALEYGAKAAFSPIIDEQWIKTYVKSLEEIMDNGMQQIRD